MLETCLPEQNLNVIKKDKIESNLFIMTLPNLFKFIVDFKIMKPVMKFFFTK